MDYLRLELLILVKFSIVIAHQKRRHAGRHVQNVADLRAVAAFHDYGFE